MKFTQIPAQYASLAGPLVYGIEADTVGTYDVQAINTTTNKIIGAKRLAGVRSATIDLAPMLRSTLEFQSEKVPTGFCDASGRSVSVIVKCGGVSSQKRTFIPGPTSVAAPSILTTMPKNRLIAHGECDDVTIFTDGGSVSLHAFGDSCDEHREYASHGDPGIAAFKLYTGEFPKAGAVTLDFGGGQTITYTVTDTIKGGRRIAWRSSAGSVEHYTFPVVKSAGVAAAKQRACNATGVVAATVDKEWRTTLCSAYETHAMLDILSEIVTSENVWVVEDQAYTPVDVVTAAAAVRRHGSIGLLEIEIVQQTKPADR